VYGGFAVAVAALGVASYLATQVWIAHRPAAAPPVQTRLVWVVERTVPADTPVSPGAIVAAHWPVTVVPPTAYTGSLNGVWAATALAPGTPVVTGAVFQPRTADSLAARLQPGTVAMNLAIPASAGADGVVAPGDRVSVIVTGTAGATPISEVFASDVFVLAINGSLTGTPTPGSPEQVMVAVTPRMAAALAYALDHATVTLVLDPIRGLIAAGADYGTQWPALPQR
jgi:Flp pilus assembly protein CpaB